jgi:hypothetical protein
MTRALIEAALILVAGYLTFEKVFTFYGDGAMKRQNKQLTRDLEVAHLALERSGLIRSFGEAELYG